MSEAELATLREEALAHQITRTGTRRSICSPSTPAG